ncbi:MAG: hypothetical protein KBC11_02985 [Candidatus Pacebacteria bacterium]|nr:hypothetical protein [Candidatus Paceibacterota bacterium]
MKKIIVERNRLKRNTWNFFSAKVYRPMSDRRFLNIILKKAEKTYYEYVSFYNQIDTESAIVVYKLKVLNNKLSKIFLFFTEVQIEFKNLIKELKLEEKFLDLTSKLEETSFSVWKDCFEKEKSLAA